MRENPLKVISYTTDLWETACPILRVLGPAERVPFLVIKGSIPGDSGLRVDLEPIAEADIVLIQREFPRHIAHYERVIEQARRHGRAIVYELDDLLTELPSEHVDWAYYRIARLPLLRAIVEADAVTTSTPGLCDYLRPYNRNVWLLPNYLNDWLWSLQPKPVPLGRAPVVIGYMGGHTHAPDLEMVAPALLRVLERHKGKAVLKFFGKAVPPPLLAERDDVSQEPLYIPDYAAFARYFSAQICDIFIAPLRDSLFNRCKSAVKFLEYSATGVPGVYSRIAPYESVVNGQNGFLATTLEEWEYALGQLIEDPALRYRMGCEAQRTVRERWLLSDHDVEWDRAYRSILGVGRETARKEIAVQVVHKAQIWQDEVETLLQQAAQWAAAGHPLEQAIPSRESLLTQIRNAVTWYSAAPIPRISARLGRRWRELTGRMH